MIEVGKFDQLGPLFGIRGDELGELRGRIRRHHQRAEIQQAPLDRRIGDRGVDRRVERVDNCRGRTFRRAKTDPAERLIAGQKFRHRRHVWQIIQALRRGDGECPQLADLDMRQRRWRNVEHHLDIPGQKIDQRRRRAVIGHMHEIDAGHVFEQFAGDMLRAADASRRHVDLARIGLSVSDEFRNGLGRK
jgi:hypothetical protein